MTLKLLKTEFHLVDAYGITYRAIFRKNVLLVYDVEIFQEEALLESYSAVMIISAAKAAELIERAAKERRATS
jgi:hypothetical protein